MAKIYTSVDQLIGRTPLLELRGIEAQYSLGARLLAKLESFNPAGSVKDRVALAMIEDAEKTGRLKEGSVIIEPTSGNTGIGLAAVGIGCLLIPPFLFFTKKLFILCGKLFAVTGRYIRGKKKKEEN